jgi:hypothetical protein
MGRTGIAAKTFTSASIGNLNNAPPDGIFGEPPVAGDPSRTFYISVPADAPKQAALTPAGTYPSAALGSAGTKLGGMEEMLVGTQANAGLTAEADQSAVLDQTEQPVQWANGWSSWNPVPGAAFDVFTGGIVQNFGKTTPATYVDIQRILATNSGAAPTGVVGGGTYVTSVAISRNGAISAQTTPVVLAPKIGVEQPAGKPLVSGKSQTNFFAVETRKLSPPRVYRITNNGTAVLSGLSVVRTGAHTRDYIVTGPVRKVLPPGAFTTFTVRFKPVAAGFRRAAISIRSNDTTQNPFVVKLVGRGKPGKPTIDVFQPARTKLVNRQARKSFGTVRLGRSSITRAFTIRNTGGAPLSRIAVRVAGLHSKDFIATRALRTTLAPGAATTFRVTFSPKVVGNRNALIRINSSDRARNPFIIRVTGRAVRP